VRRSLWFLGHCRPGQARPYQDQFRDVHGHLEQIPLRLPLWVFDGFYRRGLTNPDIQRLIRIKEQGLGRVIRIGDSAQASDIKQLNDAGISMTGVEKETGTNKENWDEWRARLMESQGRVQELTGKPKFFISSALVDMDDDPKSSTFGQNVNFLVRELESLKWEEMKTDLGVEQKPVWGKQPKHAIDALSYVLATIHQPVREKVAKQWKPSI
jgi:hypothetical protein